MSKINLILSVMLVAFTLCLSACGNSEDADASSLKSSVEQYFPETQEPSSAVKASAGQSSGGSGTQTTQKPTQKATQQGTTGGQHSQNSSVVPAATAGTDAPQSPATTAAPQRVQTTAVPSRSGQAVSRTDAKPAAESRVSQTNPLNTEPTVAQSTKTVPYDPKEDERERDNAEVDINDLL